MKQDNNSLIKSSERKIIYLRKKLETLFEIEQKNTLTFYSPFDVKDRCCNFTNYIFRENKLLQMEFHMGY